MRMRTMPFGLLAALAGLFFCAPAAPAADPVKLGVVDLQRCLNESKMGKKYKAEFTSEADQMKAELEGEEAALKGLREELEKQGMVLSETARAEKEREYQERLEEFKEKFKTSQKALQRKDQELTRRILKDLQGTIRELGETGGYTLILEKGEGGLLYTGGEVDLTDEVIRRYDSSAGE